MEHTNPNMLVREETNSVFERMHRAVWVATMDDGAVRNTRDVNILLPEG
jgi:hypothetical protein